MTPPMEGRSAARRQAALAPLSGVMNIRSASSNPRCDPPYSRIYLLVEAPQTIACVECCRGIRA